MLLRGRIIGPVIYTCPSCGSVCIGEPCKTEWVLTCARCRKRLGVGLLLWDLLPLQRFHPDDIRTPSLSMMPDLLVPPQPPVPGETIPLITVAQKQEKTIKKSHLYIDPNVENPAWVEEVALSGDYGQRLAAKKRRRRGKEYRARRQQ